MKLNERQKLILTACAQSARQPHHFTHGNLHRITSPFIIEGWLKKMAEHGLLVEQDGAYSITTLGRQKLDSDVPAAQRAVNWRGDKLDIKRDVGETYMRPGSDHSHIESVGVRC